ncbi:DUF1841 family protein, partial [Lactiplantibacillus plantarum]|uniref:DUF1841 family protein n=1 Tax=Lactiplantibacillus plantarum TaxID=1590 RepID=UPI001E41E90B
MWRSPSCRDFQVSIDQPRGIKAAHDLLVSRIGEHDAHHEIMECLGEMIWKSQRTSTPPDTEAYIECVRRRADVEFLDLGGIDRRQAADAGRLVAGIVQPEAAAFGAGARHDGRVGARIDQQL